MIHIGNEFIESPTERAATFQLKKLLAAVAAEHPVTNWHCPACGRFEQTPNALTRNRCTCDRNMEWSYA